MAQATKMNFPTVPEGGVREQGVGRVSAEGSQTSPLRVAPLVPLCPDCRCAGDASRVGPRPVARALFYLRHLCKGSPNTSRVSVLRVRASPKPLVKQLGARFSPNTCTLCWCGRTQVRVGFPTASARQTPYFCCPHLPWLVWCSLLEVFTLGSIKPRPPPISLVDFSVFLK